jgi:hypothetical protein
MFSFGYFPGVWGLKADVSEPSKTSAFKPQTPGKYPKENILHKEHGESLKSRQDKIKFLTIHMQHSPSQETNSSSASNIKRTSSLNKRKSILNSFFFITQHP